MHGPLHVDACSACHTPAGDPAQHHFELARPRDALCTSCHRPGTSAKVLHKPFEGSACQDCHDPHGGTTRNLLLEATPGELCGRCHQAAQHKVSHDPVAKGDCLACHHAHSSENEKLLVTAKKDLCVSCHKPVGAALASLPYTHGPAGVDCSACHAAHGADAKGLLLKPTRDLCIDCHDSVAEELAKNSHVHGAMDGPAACAGCHTPHASRFKSQLKSIESELCLSCHDREIVNKKTKKKVANVAKEIAAGTFKHGPVRTGDCDGCHPPHSSNHARLLRADYPPEFYKPYADESYSLCFNCHEKSLVEEERTLTLTRFRDGNQNLHFLHVRKDKGRTCRACHEIHASGQPGHIRKSVPFGASGWLLPINFTRTDSGGSCAPGCHKEKTYKNSEGSHPGAALRSGHVDPVGPPAPEPQPPGSRK